jgi:futalosine hydrolase
VKILIVAATELEIPQIKGGARGAHHIDVLITGVGMVATAARTAQALSRGNYDLAFNFGLCGSFDPAFGPGVVVHITRDRIAELGAEDGEGFLPIEDLALNAQGDVVNSNPPQNRALGELPRVNAITVNTVHGAEATIAAVLERFRPEVESMEGAAFAYACDISDVRYAQVRAVSNIVERRNRGAWQLELAVQKLDAAANAILDSL